MTIPELAIDPVFARNPEEAAVLRERHVLLVGLGSVGSALALMAARTGIGRFTLVDPEALELENVGRHMLSRDSVGVPKVQGVKRAIKSVNPAAEVRAYATDLMRLSPEDLLQPSPPDLILCGADSFACTSAVNTLSLEANIPAVYVGCWGSARVGEILYVLPGQTPCLECVLGFRRDATPTLADDPRKYTEPNFDTTRIPSQAGLWPSILLISTIAYQVALGLLLPECPMARHFLDREHTLLLVNVSDFDSPLQPLAVTVGRAERGCRVCDPSKLSEPGEDWAPLEDAA